MGGGGWRYILGGRGWVNIFYGWLVVRRGRWKYILAGWRWLDIFYGWVGVRGGRGGIFWVGGGLMGMCGGGHPF